MILSRLLLAAAGLLAFSSGCAHTSHVATKRDGDLMVKADSQPERALEDSVAATTDSVEAPLPLYLPTGKSFQGRASWYNRRTNGGSATASGERLQDTAFTAAHRTLPFGTRVCVTNLDNGKSAIVRINDRGPFIRRRIIDVTIGAARKLDMVTTGVVRCKVEVLKERKNL